MEMLILSTATSEMKCYMDA